MRGVLSSGLLVLALACLARPAHATAVIKLDDDALVASSARIIHGVVVSKQAHQTADGKRCYTEYRIRVEERLKGEGSEPVVVFREWGGRLPDGRGYWVPGVGSLSVGEEVVVFLSPTDPRTGVGFTTGLTQGKFHVKHEGGKVKASRSYGTTEEVTTLDEEGHEVRHRVETRDLAELKAMVRERLRRNLQRRKR